MFEGKKISIQELVAVTALSILVVFGVVCGLGTLTSGWHLVDDHEFLEFQYMFKYQGKSLWDVIKWAMSWDTTTRNNFLYYPLRITMCYLVGADSVAISIIKAVEIVVFMVLLYACGKKITGKFFVSLFFAFTCLVGYQSALWWKLGPEQVQAGICFGIAFLMLLKWLEAPDKRHFAVWSIVFSVLMGFFHESFILVMPFLALFPIYEKINQNGIRFKGIAGSLKKECTGLWWYTIAVMICCAVVLLEIVLRLGLNSYDPVSFDQSTSIYQYITTFIYSLKDGLKWYYYFGIALLGVILTYYDKIKNKWADVVIAIVFIAPQFVLYSKEGIAERYIIPVVIGIAMFFILFVYRNGFLNGHRKRIYAVILALMLLLNVRGMVVEGDYFRFRGESVTKVLTTTKDMSQKGYKVMCCLGNANPEADWTVDMYMKSEGLPDIYYLNTAMNKATDVRPMLKADSVNLYDIDEMDVIYAYNRDDRHFVIEPNIDFSDYVQKKCGSIDIYFKKGVIDEIGEEYLDKLSVRPTLYGIGK